MNSSSTPVARKFLSMKAMGWLMVTLGGLFYCYEVVVRLFPSAMIPELMAGFTIDRAGLGILSSAFYWGYTLTLLFAGPVIDNYPLKRVMSFATLLCALGCLMFALSTNVYLGCVSRFVMGLGSAFAFVGVLKIAAIWLPKHLFGSVTGFVSLLGMIGAFYGQNKLTSYIKTHSWENISITLAIIGAVLALLLMIFLYERKPDEQGESTKFSDDESIWHALVRILTNPIMWINGVIGCITFLPISAFSELWGIPFLENTYQLGRDQATFYNSLVLIGWAAGAPAFGIFYDALQNWHRTILWGTWAALGCIVLILLGTLPLYLLPVSLLLFGFTASSHVLVFISCRLYSPKNLTGTALSITNFFTMIGGLVFQPLLGKLLDYSIPLCENPASAYQLSLSIIPIGFAITLALIWILPCPHKRSRQMEKLQQAKLVESV
ncbi:MAG: MFS transporter [Gammaproteobacteria bacterium]